MNFQRFKIMHDIAYERGWKAGLAGTTYQDSGPYMIGAPEYETFWRAYRKGAESAANVAESAANVAESAT